MGGWSISGFAHSPSRGVRSCDVRASRVLAASLALAVVATACSTGGDTKAGSSASSTEGGRSVRLIAPLGLRRILRDERAARKDEPVRSTMSQDAAMTCMALPVK